MQMSFRQTENQRFSHILYILNGILSNYVLMQEFEQIVD